MEFENVDRFFELHRHIRYYREKAGLTQQELADKIHVSRSFISSLESNMSVKNFTMEKLFNICHALEVDPKDLFVPLP